MPSSTSSGASSIRGKPGMMASAMPATTRRMDGAVLSRRATIATTTSTAKNNNIVSIVPVMRHTMPDIRARSSAGRQTAQRAAGASGAPGGEKDEACIKAGIDKVAGQLN